MNPTTERPRRPHEHEKPAHTTVFGGPLKEEAPEEERSEEKIEAPIDEETPPFRDPLGEQEGEPEEYEAGNEADPGAPDKPAE